MLSDMEKKRESDNCNSIQQKSWNIKKLLISKNMIGFTKMTLITPKWQFKMFRFYYFLSLLTVKKVSFLHQNVLDE